jgi:hypothetical protein
MAVCVPDRLIRVGGAGAFALLVLGFSGCSNGSSTDGTGSSSGVSQGSTSGGGNGGSGAGSSGSGSAGSSGVDQNTGSSSGGSEEDGDGGASSDGGGSAAPSADGGQADDATTGTESGTPDMSHPDLGKGDGSDVILLGDSWMSNTLQIEGTGGGIAPALQQVSMQPYRNYAVQGVMMLQSDAFGPAIPTQYPAAKAANPNIKTVVMTGGGNDIIQNATLQTDCMNGGAMCKMTLDQIGDAFNTLWTQMAADGVEDVVRINYSNDVGSVAQSLRGDGGAPEPTICSSGKIRCWEYDSTNAVMKQIAADGIHPLAAANQRVATEVYALMTNEGMRR